MSSTEHADIHPNVRRILRHKTEQRTPQWHKYRSKRVTASEVSTVIAQGKGAKSLMIKKKCSGGGGSCSGFSSEYTRIGTENEEIVVQKYREMFPDVVVYSNLSIVPHKTEKHIAASLDACTNTGINVEIKTCFKDTFVNPPKSYRDQVQLQMEVADLERTHLVYQYINIPGKPIVIHEIPRCRNWFAKNAPILRKFADELQNFCMFDLGILKTQFDKFCVKNPQIFI